MRLLYAADPFVPVPPVYYGGIERVVASLVTAAVEAGHEVALLAHAESNIPGARLFPFPAPIHGAWPDVFQNARRLGAAARDFQPDLIHSFSRLAHLLPVLGAPVPKIMSFQRDPTPRTVRWADRLSHGSLVFVGCSEAISDQGRCGGGHWVTVPNGVDLARYDFRPAVAQDAPLVFLSRIERIKGAHRAIAAARAAARPLVIAGPHAEKGPEADYWRREIAPHLDRDGISCIGPVDDIQKNQLLGRAAALLVPIEWEEPFGLVFIEALACGTPVISCPRGALREIVTPGLDGFLCRTDAELIQAIRYAPELSRANCRRTAEDRFSSAGMYAGYEELYRRLAHQPTRAAASIQPGRPRPRGTGLEPTAR